MPYLLPHNHARGHRKSPVKPHMPPSWSRMSIHDRQSTMVNTCVVPGCGSRSDRDHQLSFHRLPLKNKTLLRQWLHHTGRKNVPLNNNSRICSRHFKNSHKRKLQSDEYPTENLPKLFIQQPSLPELQQRTFSRYKNHNTYKGLIGISPSGAVTFVSELYPGSISDKELTRQSGLLDLLDRDDSIMADRGFDILEDLAPRGVKLNIPPFLRGKTQLDERELLETRRIALLRIHVERCMERIKNFHIFDGVMPLSLIDVADQIFFVCAVLTNFRMYLDFYFSK